MATLALSREFNEDLRKLEPDIRSKVYETVEKFRARSGQELYADKGLHLEPYNNARDPRARTVRIKKGIRGVVMAIADDFFVLTRVLDHDDADRWMLNNEFKVNEETGAVEIVSALDPDVVGPLEPEKPAEAEQRLFAHRRDKDFTQLGISGDLVSMLRALTDADQLTGLIELLPESQTETLIHLADEEMSVEQIYRQITGSGAHEEVDTDDVVAALERPASQSMFYVLKPEDELLQMLSGDFEAWRAYLHPSQRAVAYHSGFNGPARVTGGPGTGKTVAALHRAAHLAEHGRGKVLFTSYSRTLAEALAIDLGHLAPEFAEQVEVANIDSLAHRIVAAEEGRPPKVVSPRRQEDLWEQVARDGVLDGMPPIRAGRFLRAEWESVILPQEITSRDGYLIASRRGRGARLSRRQRAEIWKSIEAFTQALAEEECRTFFQLADAAAGYLKVTGPLYEHVIVDEAQDMHAAQWRLLRACVPEAKNDMFIVGDSHQRIFGNPLRLSDYGIDIRGRSRKLRVNYRTTREILNWTLSIVSGVDYDDLDGGHEGQEGYQSRLSGPAPEREGYASHAAEMRGLVDAVTAWTTAGENGAAPHGAEIGVIAPTNAAVERACDALTHAGFRARVLSRSDNHRTEPDLIQLVSMHRAKGLEYRCVAVIDVSDGVIPHRHVTPEDEDPVQHRYDMTQQRSLLYVACSRARDVLRVSWSGEPSPFVEGLS